MKEDQLFFAPHAVDNRRFQESDEERRARAGDWRSSLGIPVEDIVFLFAGKLESKKNPMLLLDAFKLLNNSSAHLVYAGSGRPLPIRGSCELVEPRHLYPDTLRHGGVWLSNLEELLC